MPELAVTGWTAIVCSAACMMFVLVTWGIDARRRRKSDGRSTGNEPWMLRASLLPLVLAVVAGIISVYALILRLAFGAQDFRLPTEANVTSPVLVAATLVAGVLTAAYAVLRLRAHLLAEAKGRLDAHSNKLADRKYLDEREVVHAQRFADAVALLADQQSISRIAGVHLILSVGDEWESEGAQQRCFDVLVSHLRVLRKEALGEEGSVSRSDREEVRLITRELLSRLRDSDDSWDVSAGDFSGTVVADPKFDGLNTFATLDLQGAKILGDLTIPESASENAPILAELECEGALNVEWNDEWTDQELDLSGAQFGGYVTLTGKTMDASLNATELIVNGELSLSFEAFEGNVALDSSRISGGVVVGSYELGATFGTKTKAPVLSLIGASFEELKLCRSARAPQLNLTDAKGAVDLSHSVFPLEVTANRLDARTGLTLRGTKFQAALVLDGASMPSSIDFEGMYLSEPAKSAISSSEFDLRDQFLRYGQAEVPVRSAERNGHFNWRGAIEAFDSEKEEPLLKEIAIRLGQIENDLPYDWQNRPTFTSRVSSEVARAAAKVGATASAEKALRKALIEKIPLSPPDGEPT